VINATLDGALATGGDLTAWLLLGGLGNDSIVGGDNNDTALGGAGTDSIFGGAGLDSLLGEAGNDTIDGGLGNDSISGGANDDSLLGSAGDDTLDGGTGDDTFFFAKTGVADLTYLTATTSLVGGTGTDTIRFADGNVNVADTSYVLASQIESIVGGTGNDTLSFGTNATALTDLAGVLGGAGNDSLVLESAYNSATNPITLDGGANDDIFLIDSYSQIQPVGNSTLIGGAGTDTLAFATAIGTAGTPAVVSDANVQTVEVMKLADTGSNYLVVNGAFGIDTILGGATNANYINAQGLDAGNAVTLAGGSAADTLLGGPGADWLQGFAFGGSAAALAAATSDTLTGGALADTFVLGDSAGNAYAGAGAQANVVDFNIDAVFAPVTSDVFRLFTNTAAVLPGSFVAGVAPSTWEIQTAGAAVVYTIAYTDGAGVGTGTITDNIAGTQIASFNYSGSGANLVAGNFQLA
jgi:Ca2+-binding RTX toxin-like protein